MLAISNLVDTSGPVVAVRQAFSSRIRGEALALYSADGCDALADLVKYPDITSFDPFFTTKPIGRGSGQGSSIARTIVVDRNGGTLTFETSLGRGTSFLVTLPR